MVVPVGVKTGFRADREAREALARMPSSVVMVVVEAGWGDEVPSAPPPSEGGLVTVTGTVSRAKRFAFCAVEAFWWEDRAKASWSARLMLYRVATFSLVRPMGIMQSRASLTGLVFSSGQRSVGTALLP